MLLQPDTVARKVSIWRLLQPHSILAMPTLSKYAQACDGNLHVLLQKFTIPGMMNFCSLLLTSMTPSFTFKNITVRMGSMKNCHKIILCTCTPDLPLLPCLVVVAAILAANRVDNGFYGNQTIHFSKCSSHSANITCTLSCDPLLCWKECDLSYNSRFFIHTLLTEISLVSR